MKTEYHQVNKTLLNVTNLKKIWNVDDSTSAGKGDKKKEKKEKGGLHLSDSNESWPPSQSRVVLALSFQAVHPLFCRQRIWRAPGVSLDLKMTMSHSQCRFSCSLNYTTTSRQSGFLEMDTDELASLTLIKSQTSWSHFSCQAVKFPGYGMQAPTMQRPLRITYSTFVFSYWEDFRLMFLLC